MISVLDAETKIAESSISMDTESVDLKDAEGRVLAVDINADRDLPPYDRVTMDGIAIRYENWEKGQLAYRIEGIARAGEKELKLMDSNACFEVMTGAVMPLNTDCIIRVEDLNVESGIAEIKADIALRYKQNIHFKGSDRTAGTILLTRGCRLHSAQLAVLAVP